jgi:hypothetical protein
LAQSKKINVIEAENLIYVVHSGLAGNYNMLEVSFLNSALGKVFRLGAMLNPLYDTSVLNFAYSFNRK